MGCASSHKLSVPSPLSRGEGVRSSSPSAGGAGHEGLSWAGFTGTNKSYEQMAQNAVTLAPCRLSTMDSVFPRLTGLMPLLRVRVSNKPLVSHCSLGHHHPPSAVMILVLFRHEGAKIHPCCSRHAF